MKKIKVGMVGLVFGNVLINELLSPANNQQYEITALCDLDRERTDRFVERLGIKGYYDMDEMLAQSEMDAVVIITEPRGRANLIRKAIRAGKHVMTTKPFEACAEEAMSVLQEAKDLGKVIHINSPSPLYTQDLQIITDWQKEYNLGRPIGCQCAVWVNYRETPDGRWLDDPKRCPVAPVYRLGIYLINDLVRLLGEAEYVSVMQSWIFTQRPTADNAQLGIAFKNGAMAQVFASFCVNDTQTYNNSITLCYENGTVYRNVRRHTNACELTLIRPNGENQPITEMRTAQTTSGMYQWDAFFRAVNGEKLDGEVAPGQVVEGVKIISAMARAQESGRVEMV